jgi:hypothetical protein
MADGCLYVNASANLARLKQPATDRYARMQSP